MILRRQDGSLSFYQPFQNYQNGFGHPQYEYWAGLNAIYYLTYTGKSNESGEGCFTFKRTMYMYLRLVLLERCKSNIFKSVVSFCELCKFDKSDASDGGERREMEIK